MALLLTQMQVSLALLKILGGFPYKDTKSHSAIPESPRQELLNDQENSAGRNKTIPSYTKNIFLEVLTSVAVSLLYIIYGSLITFEICSGDDERSSRRGGTYSVADSIEDFVNLVSILLIGIYFILKRGYALEVVMKFHRLTVKIPLGARSSSFSHLFTISVLLFVSITTIFVGKKILLLSSFFVIANIGEMLEIVFNFLCYFFIMSFYHSSMSMITSAYFIITKDLMTAKERRKCCKNDKKDWMNDVEHYLEKCACEDFFQDKDLGECENICAMIIGNREEDYIKPLECSKELLLDVQDYQRHLHDYIGLPIGVILLSSVFSCVIAIYVMLLEWSLITFYPLINILNIFLSVLPVCIFANIANEAQLKVEDLMLLVNATRRDPKFCNLKEQFDELKEILDESPGFELCNVFTLGRARILDIFSHVATYLVILLQFRTTESDKYEACNKTNTVGS